MWSDPGFARALGSGHEDAALVIGTRFETMGLLVFERIAPFKLVENLCGGIVVVMWRKLGPWLEAVRIEQAQPSWGEWFQWLAQQKRANNSREESDACGGTGR